MAGRKAWIWAALGFLLAALAACVVFLVVLSGRPTVVERWTLYVERLAPERRLLVLSSAQRHKASKEFTAKILAIVPVKASVEIEAWADVFYVVDAADPRLWSISWNRRTRVLRLRAPEPDCLPPAVRTDSIEVRTKGANLLTNTIFRLKEEARRLQAELSAEFAVEARKALGDPALRAGAQAGLEGLARSFCRSALGQEPASVLASFAGDAE